jgi:hypothetical protein
MAHSDAPTFGVGEGGKSFSLQGFGILWCVVVLGSPHVVRPVGS